MSSLTHSSTFFSKGLCLMLWKNMTQRAHNVDITSHWRRCDVITSHRRHVPAGDGQDSPVGRTSFHYRICMYALVTKFCIIHVLAFITSNMCICSAAFMTSNMCICSGTPAGEDKCRLCLRPIHWLMYVCICCHEILNKQNYYQSEVCRWHWCSCWRRAETRSIVDLHKA